VLELCDLVLVMSVNPGFGGQRFIPAGAPEDPPAARPIDELGLKTRIEVDGGIHEGTIAGPASDGADVFVAGNGIFKHPRHGHDYGAAMAALRRAVTP
jgi:ribulose-phosphate 3-epimerase